MNLKQKEVFLKSLKASEITQKEPHSMLNSKH